MTSEGIRARPRRRCWAVRPLCPGLTAAALLCTLPASAETAPVAKSNTPAPADAYVYIGWPNNGQVINAGRLADGGFRVWFGLRNMGVAPAGVDIPNTGHHHLLIDVGLPPLDQEIPSDKNHLHFGHGQTETVLQLPPGRHTLQLLLGDKNHFPHNPPVYSKIITITVK